MREAIIQRLARECGFAIAGVARAVPLPDADTYLDWVSRGLAGKMGYLTDRRAHLRTDPRSLAPTARSMVCVGRLYDASRSGQVIARYAQDSDYHVSMERDLERLAGLLRSEFGPFEYKVCVDTAPLLERSYARMAGLGWIGRNTCVINQELGSWLLLGELLTSLELEPGVPAPDRCGTCQRCIEACPTAALQPGGLRTELDATRCISYFTIELKGEIPAGERPATGTHVFGCDICQEVCPWNQPETGEGGPRLEEFADLSADEFRQRFRDTPIWRSRYSGFLRNVAVAMGNSGDGKYRGALESLSESEDAVVASHAEWALERLP